jgi:putative transcriptional regulator
LLLEIVWDAAPDIQTRTVDMHVQRLRTKLGAAGEMIETVMTGGPVQPERGFVLHQSIETYESTVDPKAEVKVTVSQDVLRAIARGEGPKPALVALGYAGWGGGQLEAELAANAWLHVPAAASVLFETPVENRWLAAAGLIGIDIRQVTSYAGHA